MNTEPKPKLHVVFNPSAASSIRQAFARIDCHERVIGLLDNLSFGPIDSPNAQLRQDAIEAAFDFDYQDVVQTADQFWTEATSPDVLPVAWVCRNDAGEHAGFLEFIWKMADAPFRVIDITGEEFARRRSRSGASALSLGVVPAEKIVESRLLDRQTALSPKDIEAYRETWRRLRMENAPLRIVDETGLVSAPITYFDDALCACASDEWRKGAHLIGTTMVSLWDSPLGQCPSDLVLWARVCALADAGVLELSGDGSIMRDTLVRRSQSPGRR